MLQIYHNLTSACWLPSAWQLPDDCLMTNWWLPDVYLMIMYLPDFWGVFNRLNHSNTTKTTREKQLEAVHNLKKKNITLITGHCDRIQFQKDFIFFRQILTRSATVWSLKPCRWGHPQMTSREKGAKKWPKRAKKGANKCWHGRKGVKKYEKNCYRISFSRTILQIILAILIILCINFFILILAFEDHEK